MLPIISVIIPVYNRENYLERCLTSVLNQTYKDLEILLIDDGSEDNSLKICREFEVRDSRIKVICQKNQGVSVARNVGIEKSIGEYIGFVDSDDWIEHDMYSFLYKLINKYRADIAISAIRKNNSSRKVKIYDKEAGTKQLLSGNKFGMVCWNKLYKKELFQLVRFPVGIKIGEDAITTLNLFLKASLIIYQNTIKYHQEASENNCASRYQIDVKYNVLSIYKNFIILCERELPRVKNAAIDRYMIGIVGFFLAVDNKEDLEKFRKIKQETRKYLKIFLVSKDPLLRYKFSVTIIAVNPAIFNFLVNFTKNR